VIVQIGPCCVGRFIAWLCLGGLREVCAAGLRAASALLGMIVLEPDSWRTVICVSCGRSACRCRCPSPYIRQGRWHG
jgi:hypothetical protein